ncbi:MAG: ferrochelatase [Prolixibacteraceae bacterium]|jgi:ferrochelatase|nr:ferrochelatase [Prolixibacteraceae bacterium]
MTTGKTAVILINVGTPDSPSVGDVRKYLSEFLNDPRVIDLPWAVRKILVNLIIVPFRAPKSAKLYKLLWTEKGSPLNVISNSVRDKLQGQLGGNYTFFVAMRYANPNIRDVMERIRTGGFSRLIVVPMFPHFASSSTGTANEAVMQQLKKWTVIPEVKFVGQFYDHPQFIDAYADRIRSYQPEKYDHVLFSYHGLPLSHINSVHPGIDCENCSCTLKFPEHGEFCYKATTYETTRLLAAKLGLTEGKFSQSFQSRLSDKWLKPYTDKVLVQKVAEGVKNILVVAPAFVSDCLETTVELGIDYRKRFKDAGGEQLDYVESLNDMPAWIDLLKNLVEHA